MKRRKNDLEEGNRPMKKLRERQRFFVAWRQVARRAEVVKDIENEQKRQVEVVKDIIEKQKRVKKQLGMITWQKREQKRVLEVRKAKRRKTFLIC
jgi:hypothetical protein